MKIAIFQNRIVTLFKKKIPGDYCSPQYCSYRVISIATAYGPLNFLMKIPPCILTHVRREATLLKPYKILLFDNFITNFPSIGYPPKVSEYRLVNMDNSRLMTILKNN